MTYIWNQKDVPHKGWTLDGYEELDRADHTCEMCGRPEIRFVHYMSHPTGLMRAVGCNCAEKMTDDYEEHEKIRQQDKWLKSRSQKRKNFDKDRDLFLNTKWANLPAGISFKGSNKIKAFISFSNNGKKWRYSYNVKIKKEIFTGHSMLQKTAQEQIEQIVKNYKLVL